MPRGLSAGQLAELVKRAKRPVYFVECQLDAGTVRMWNGVGTITALAQTWTGVGDFGLIEGVGSNEALKASQISIALVGLPSALITPSIMASTRGVEYQGRPLKVYIGFLDADTDALLQAPTVIWAGVCDVVTWRISDTVSVSLSGEHYSSFLRQVNGLRMTPESHNTRLGNPSPRDNSFDFQGRQLGRPKPLL